MSGKHLNVDMRFTADTSQAKNSIQELNRLLDKALNQPSIGLGGSGISAEINKAKIAATELKVKLQDAMRTDGSLDLVKFNNSLQTSGKTLGDYGSALSKLGANGKQAFLQLTQSISTANVSLERSNSMINQMWITLKNVARFQISSSVIHTLVGGISSAYGYAQNLNESLNNIRIVTNQSAEEMSLFADRANKAARSLSSTTLDYTNASLIYYQQGLTDEEVARRTEATLKLANVSRQTAETVSDQMTAVWNNFDDGSKSLEYYADVMSALGAATASSQAEIAVGMEKFASVASTVGLSYENAAAALATIVAQTRQSADTVGTGLRTIFARLQSLKLGKTLEDGVGLTKYTEALAKIGVNVLDANGKLKEMDTILFDIGEKWQTLDETSRITVANTVGGVRQYTNLIALFDNFDKFKDNIQIAESSEGTLNKQAEIYAEGWEAARDRVKAAAEAIYSSLINDDFFIDVNDFIEKNLDGINNLIKALGGLPGVLSVVSTAFLTIFGPQLSSSIDNLIQRIRFFFGYTQKEIIAMKQDANNQLANMYAGATHTKDQVAGTAYKSQAAYSNIILEQQLNKKKQLSAEEAKIVTLLQEQHNILVQNTIEAGKELQKAQEQFGIEKARISNAAQRHSNNVEVNDKQFWDSSSSFDDILGKLTSVNTKEAQEGFKLLKQEIKAVEDAAHSGKQTVEKFLEGKGYSSEAIKAFQTLQTACTGVKDNLKSVEANAAKVVDRFLALKNTSNEFDKTKYDTQISNLQKYAKELAIVETTMQSFAKIDFSKNTNNLTSFEAIINGIEQSTKQFGHTVEEVYGTNTQRLFDEFKAKFEAAIKDPSKGFDEVNQAAEAFFNKIQGRSGELNTDIQTSLETIKNIIKPFTTDIDGAMRALEDHFNNVQGASKDVTTGFFNMSSSAAILKEYLQQVKGELQSIGQSLTTVASGLTALASFINTIKGLKETWNDTSKSMSDKMLSTAAASGTLMFSLDRMIKGANAVPKLFESIGKFAIKTGTSINSAVPAIGALTAGLSEAGAAIATFAATATIVIAILAGVVIAIKSFYDATHKARQAYAEQVEATKKAKEEFEKATETYNQLKSTIEDYTEARNSIDSLTEGTKEWREAIEKTNEEALKLIELWPELASKVKINSNGALIFEEADLEQAQRASRIDEVQKQVELARNTYLEKELAVDSAIEGVVQSGFLGLRKYTEEEINDAINSLKNNKELSTFLKYYFPKMEQEIEDARAEAFDKALNANPYDKLGAAEAADEAEVSLYRNTLDRLGFDKDFLSGLDNEEIINFFESLSTKMKDLEPIITALDEFSTAENAYSTQVNSAVIKMAQELKSDNAGLAAALMDVDIAKAGGPEADVEKVRQIILNAQSFVEAADVLAAQFQNNEDQLNAIIAIVRNQNPDLSGFNRQELKTFGKKFVGQAHNLGYANRLEAEEVFDGVTQDWENTFSKIFQELPKYTQKFLEDFMTNLTKFDTISPDQYKRIGEQLIEAIGLGNDLTSFKSLKEMFEIAGDRAGELSDVLDGVDWQTVTVSELSDKLIAAGFAADDFKVPLEKIIELMKEAAGITFDEAAERYKNAKKVISDLEYGKEISSDDYGYLQKYEDQINEYLAAHESEFEFDTLRHYFSRTATGDYSFKGDAEEFQEIFNTIVLEEFNKGLQDSIESFNALKEIANTAEGYQEKYNQASNSIDGMLSFIQTIQGENKSPEIKIAEDLYNQNSGLYQGTEGIEAFKDANPEVYERLLQIFESLKNLYPELVQEIEDYEESIHNFEEAVDGIDTEKLKELDSDVNNDALKERIAFLKEYGAELYGISEKTLNNTEAIRLIAEEMLRAEAAAKRFQSSWKDWLEGFQSGKITIQMLQDLENTYSDLLNLSQNSHLSKSFLESAENAQLMKEALDGSAEAYDELLEKASDDIIYGMKESIKAAIEDDQGALDFELEGHIDTDKLADDIVTQLDYLQDILNGMDLEVGAEINDEAFINSLNEIINMAGWTAKQASEELSKMGINAKVVQGPPEPANSPAKYTYFKPATYTIKTEQLPDGQGGYKPFSYPELAEEAQMVDKPGVDQTTSPSSYAIHVESATFTGQGSGGQITHQKLGNTSSGTGGGKSSGGGGSSGSEKKPRPLTHHVKADAGERYHAITKKLDNVKKAQDEASRRKERAFGAEKIAQLEKEISLRKETLELQSDYMKEIQEFLSQDKSDMMSQLGSLGIKVEIDKDGVISNYQEIQDALLDMENALIDEENSYNATGDEIPDSINEQKTALEDAKKAISQYEETLGKLEDQIYSTATGIDELNDAFFELITTKIELKISIADDDAKLLEYFLEKYSDDAYKAAEAISIFGKQTTNTLDKIKIYETGLIDLLKSKGMTMADLSNLDDERVKSLIENGDFTEEQIEQIRDWRDSILEANQALLEMRGNIVDKILDVFDEFNDKVKTQYDLFSHYKNTLQVYKDVTDLMGRSINKEQKKLISDLNNAMLENSKNTIEAAKKRYKDLIMQRSEAQALYNTALAEGGEKAAREYEELLETLDSEIKDSEEEYLSSWQETMEQAQTIFEQMIEDITDKFNEAMSGAFGSLDYLKEAFNRQSESDDLYLQDYDKLYELNKLQRDLNKTLSDTRGVTNRKELLEIQRQINEYQVEGVRLSQYDLEALRAKLEMQQAYNDLQIAQDAKHTVRLSRDAEGNWGYIYTANQEEIAQAEQQYEDKLHAYQELNDNYIQELQEKALEVQTTYREILTEIMKDTTLDDQQRRARIEELNIWLANQQNYFNNQSLSAFNNQADTMNRMLSVYQATGADLIDLWEKTKLASLTGMDSIQDYMDNWVTASDSFLYNMSDALKDRQKMLDSILELTGTSISQFANQVSLVTTGVGDASEETKNQVSDLSNLLNEKFSDALAQAVSWEKEYAKGIIDMTQQNEKMIASLNDLIATLATLRSYNHLHDSLDDYLAASRNYSSGKMSKEQFKSISEKFDAELREATSLDTGGYTGNWGPEGKIAILHEHEQIFNENDTNNLLEAATILRQIDISAMSMAQGLGNLFSPSIGGFEQTLQQEVHIEAVFPDATDHNEIEEAFDNLVNRAIQYANRKI